MMGTAPSSAFAPGRSLDAPSKGNHVNLRLIDWIWCVRGSVPLAPAQSGEEAFDRLAPLFRETGTSHQRANGVLTFEKKDQAAQDAMSVFDGGALCIEDDGGAPVLRYRLTSRALLFCFLAPLLFLAFAQLTVIVNAHQKSAETASASGKKADAAKDAKKAAPLPQNPIDKFLGSPAPEKPKKGEEGGRRGRKPTPTPGYVFAAIFASLYVVGRVLEDRLVRSLFRKRLLGS